VIPVLPSALFFRQGKQERDHAQCDQDCRDGKTRRGNFRPRMKIGFEPRRHADQEEKQRQVNENYAQRFFGFG